MKKRTLGGAIVRGVAALAAPAVVLWCGIAAAQTPTGAPTGAAPGAAAAPAGQSPTGTTAATPQDPGTQGLAVGDLQGSGGAQAIVQNLDAAAGSPSISSPRFLNTSN